MPVTEAHNRAAGRRQYHGHAPARRPQRCRPPRPVAPARRPQRVRPPRRVPMATSPSGHARPAVRRSALVGMFAILLATCAVWVQGGGGRTGSDPLTAPGAGRTAPAAAHVWVVQPGDTLWGIAHRLDPNADPRPLVDALAREVHGRPLQVGQELALP